MAIFDYPSSDDIAFWMNDINDQAQGTAAFANNYVRVLCNNAIEEGFESVDRYTDEGYANGYAVRMIDNLNFGHMPFSIQLLPSVPDLHGLLVWMSQAKSNGAGAHTYPLDLLTGTGLCNGRRFHYYNATSATDGYYASGFPVSFEQVIGKTGNNVATIAFNHSTKTTETKPVAGFQGSKIPLKREFVTFSFLGGVAHCQTLTIRLERQQLHIAPDFGDSSKVTKQYNFGGNWELTISGEGYLSVANYDPLTDFIADTEIDLTTDIAFNDGTNSFSLQLERAKYTNVTYPDRNGLRGFNFECRGLGNATTGVLAKVSALA